MVSAGMRSKISFWVHRCFAPWLVLEIFTQVENSGKIGVVAIVDTKVGKKGFSLPPGWRGLKLPDNCWVCCCSIGPDDPALNYFSLLSD